MNEWQTIAWFAALGGGFLGVTWKMVDQARRDIINQIKIMVEAEKLRIDRLEHVIDSIVKDIGDQNEQFITTKGFDRFEGHLINRIDTVQRGVDSLAKRFDDYIVTQRNGSRKSGG